MSYHLDMPFGKNGAYRNLSQKSCDRYSNTTPHGEEVSRDAQNTSSKKC